MFKQLQFEPVLDRPDLVPVGITELLKTWQGSVPASEVMVAPIDPNFAGSTEFCEKYQVLPELGANCVVVEAVRGENRFLAACLVPVHTRADLNKTVRKLLDVRRVSFAPLDEVLQATGMEYGGITPVGLPNSFSILIDARVIALEKVIIGGGYRKSKLLVPGAFLSELPNAQVVEGLGV